MTSRILFLNCLSLSLRVLCVCTCLCPVYLQCLRRPRSAPDVPGIAASDSYEASNVSAGN